MARRQLLPQKRGFHLITISRISGASLPTEPTSSLPAALQTHLSTSGSDYEAAGAERLPTVPLWSLRAL